MAARGAWGEGHGGCREHEDGEEEQQESGCPGLSPGSATYRLGDFGHVLLRLSEPGPPHP